MEDLCYGLSFIKNKSGLKDSLVLAVQLLAGLRLFLQTGPILHYRVLDPLHQLAALLAALVIDHSFDWSLDLVLDQPHLFFLNNQIFTFLKMWTSFYSRYFFSLSWVVRLLIVSKLSLDFESVKVVLRFWSLRSFNFFFKTEASSVWALFWLSRSLAFFLAMKSSSSAMRYFAYNFFNSFSLNLPKGTFSQNSILSILASCTNWRDWTLQSTSFLNIFSAPPSKPPRVHCPSCEEMCWIGISWARACFWWAAQRDPHPRAMTKVWDFPVWMKYPWAWGYQSFSRLICWCFPWVRSPSGRAVGKSFSCIWSKSHIASRKRKTHSVGRDCPAIWMRTAAKYGSTPRTWRSIYKYIATEKHALIKYSLDTSDSPRQYEAQGRSKEVKGPREMKIGGFCYFIWGGKGFGWVWIFYWMRGLGSVS